jgi:hydrogenase maturation factor HypF (carbamoyltransferase family)
MSLNIVVGFDINLPEGVNWEGSDVKKYLEKYTEVKPPLAKIEMICKSEFTKKTMITIRILNGTPLAKTKLKTTMERDISNLGYQIRKPKVLNWV